MLTALLAFALAAPPQDGARLVVVATTDVRGDVLGWDYAADRPAAGGLARVASLVDSLRAQYPGRVLVVDAGDALTGSAFASYAGRVAPRDPHPVVEALGLAGYDVAALGDRDFDLGPAPVRRAVAGASFPFVNANLLVAGGDTSMYAPFVVLRRDRVRVAVAGFVAPDAIAAGDARLGAGLRAAPIADVAPRTLAAARGAADVVVALAHGGMEGTPAARPARAALTGGRARPDVVIAGYAGRAVADSVAGDVRVVRPRPGAGEVAVIHLWLVRRGDGWRVARHAVDRVSIGAVAPATRLVNRLAGGHAAVRGWVGAPVGRTRTAFPAAAARAGPSAATDFANRVWRERAGADLAATPAYTLDAGMPRGGVRRADLLALYPHDERLLAVRISGAELAAYLEHAARYFRVDAVGRVALSDGVAGADFDIVGGAAYDIDLRARAGARVRRLSVRGRPVAPSDSFTVAIGSRRRAGIGGYPAVAAAPIVYDRGEHLWDVLAEEVGRRSPLDSVDYAERGWRIVPASLAAGVRTLFGLSDDAPPRPSVPGDRLVLRVLAVGDLRGRIDALPRLKAAMDSLTRVCDCPVVRLGGGDAATTAGMSVVGGVADAGASPAELLGRAGLAAAALGERELASAPATLQRAMAASGYPWLAANLFDSATGRRPTWSESFRMISAADRRVAVVGYLGESAAALLSAERGEALRVAGGALALKASLDAARAAAPDLTVLLAHAAADEIAQLVRDLPRGSVDLVVAGHGAAPRADSANGVPVIRGSAGGDTLAVADLFVTATGARQVRSSVIPIPADASQDPMLAALVQRALGRRDSALAAPLATLKLPLSAHSAALGRLIAEARRNALRADLGVVSADEIGAGLAAGPVSYRELLRVQPRGRTLLLVSATGAELRALFERLVEGGAASAHLAGVEVRYDPERRPGRRVRQVVLPGGGELRHDREYRLAVDETFTETPGRERRDRRGPERSDVLDVDALALYLRRLSQPVEVSGRPSFFSIEP